MEIPRYGSTSVNPLNLRDQRRSSRMTDVSGDSGTSQTEAFPNVQPGTATLANHQLMSDPKSSGEYSHSKSTVRQDRTSKMVQASCALSLAARLLVGDGSDEDASVKTHEHQNTRQGVNEVNIGGGDISENVGASSTLTPTARKVLSALQKAATKIAEKRNNGQGQVKTGRSDVLYTSRAPTSSVVRNAENKKNDRQFQSDNSYITVSHVDHERIMTDASLNGLQEGDGDSTNGQRMNAVTALASSLQAAREIDMDVFGTPSEFSPLQQSYSAAMQKWAASHAVPSAKHGIVAEATSQNQQISADAFQVNTQTLTPPNGQVAANTRATTKFVPLSTKDTVFATDQHINSNRSTVTPDTHFGYSPFQPLHDPPILSTEPSLVFRKFGCTSLPPHVILSPYERIIRRNMPSELVLQKWGSKRVSNVSQGFTSPVQINTPSPFTQGFILPGQTTTPSPFAQGFTLPGQTTQISPFTQGFTSPGQDSPSSLFAQGFALPSQTTEPSPFAQQTVPLTGYTIPQSHGHTHTNPNALIAGPSMTDLNDPEIEGELIPYDQYLHHSLPGWRPDLPPGSDCYSVITAESPLPNLCVGQKYIRKETRME